MRPRHAWTYLALGILAGLAGLALLSRLVLTRSRASAEAAVEAQLAEDLRSALARMDLCFAPLLARVAARAESALVEAGVEVPVYRVELPDGTAVPDPEAAEPAEHLRARSDKAWNDIERPPFALAAIPPRGTTRDQWMQRGDERSNQEYLARQGTPYLPNYQNVSTVKSQLEPGGTSLRAGALATGWEGKGADSVLVFGRRLEHGGRVSYQAFRFHWPALAELLLSFTRDLFPDARLEPLEPDAPPSGDRLATLPARLVVPNAALPLVTDRTLVASLAGAWLLAITAVGGAALALRASLADADRQRRFTAAVTHELRTPLTTFRLYGEMLARGMVPAERQGEYLETLVREAGRLGALVENVLAYARLEQGRAQPARARWSVRELVETHRPALERRCAQVGTTLAVELDTAAGAWVDTDAEGVGLVLSNLVDNACKYGAPAGGHALERPLRLSSRRDGTRVGLVLADPGPGIPSALAHAIFRPFERGGRDESDPAPGIGLGLALARDVARALGGELELEPGNRGARFVLWLPLAREDRAQ